MKILICTDNHFCQYSSSLRSKGQTYSTRLENQISSINWCEELAKNKDCKLVVHLGDFFDRPDLNAEELSALKEIQWSDIPHVFLVGNHEMASVDSSINSVNVLSKIGKIIDKPCMDSFYGCELIYLPYILETERKPLQDYINEIYKEYWTTKEDKYRIIFSHNDLKGIRYGQYQSKQGFDIKEISNNCDLFINGHLHNQTQINEKILNLGNLTGQNFSEDGFKYSHSVAILDTDTLNIELINNPYAINFYKIDLSTDYSLKKLKEIINKVENGVLSVKVPQNKLEEVREYLKICSNVLEYRVIANLNWNSNENNTATLTKIDHLQQFKDYIITELGSTDVVLEELNNLN